MTAYQMVHIMEGVIQRGTATVLRDLDRPLFGKTGTTIGPDQRLVRRRLAAISSAASISATTSRGRWAAMPRAARIAAPIFKQFAQVAMKDMPIVPFRAPPGIRMVRIDRRSGKPVFGAWPTTTIPRRAVIWEAFKPESEPRRTIRRDAIDRAAAARRARPRRRPSDRATATSCKDRAGFTRPARSAGRIPAKAGIQPARSSGSRPSPGRQSIGDFRCAPKRKPISTRSTPRSALLRRFLDWDRALQRLDELNARSRTRRCGTIPRRRRR